MILYIGAIILRSLGRQDIFIQESCKRLDRNLRCSFASLLTSNWLSLRLQMIGAVVVISICVAAVVQKEMAMNINAGLFGLALSYSLPIVGTLNGLINSFANTEKEMISVERLEEFHNVPSENEVIESKNESRKTSWSPNSGSIKITNLTVKYNNNTTALKNIFLSINDKEKLFVVGRSGAGKSSFLLALMRMMAWDGDIEIDHVSIKNVDLRELRGSFALIPQKPILINGSIRDNLDPMRNYTDESIWNALEAVQLKEIFSNCKYGLNTLLDENNNTNGSVHLSNGQAQLICISRALLKKSHILLIDEAASSLGIYYCHKYITDIFIFIAVIYTHIYIYTLYINHF